MEPSDPVDPQPGFCEINTHCSSYVDRTLPLFLRIFSMINNHSLSFGFRYNDGCNTCQCTPNGEAACTRKMCIHTDSLIDPKCTECENGYSVDDTGSCIAVKGNVLHFDVPCFKIEYESEFIILQITKIEAGVVDVSPLPAPLSSKVAPAAEAVQSVQTAFTCDFFGYACTAYVT